MEMMFLILMINREGVVLPQPYPKEQCEKIIENRNGICIAAPVDDYNCTTTMPLYNNGYGGLAVPTIVKYHCDPTIGKQ